jgi:aspartate/methionine/tyrosine aminotransferase
MEVGRSYCEPHLKELAEVREMVVTELSKLAPRLTLPTADGAFYAFVKVDTAMDPMTLVERLVREHKVAVLPGSTFGMTDACYLRIAYGALQKATVEEGIGRFVRGLGAIAG